MVAQSGARKLRVLCMPGFRTNVKIMQDQTRGLRRAMGSHAEFVFLNGPIEARGPSDTSIEALYANHKPFYEWGRSQTEREDVLDASTQTFVAGDSEDFNTMVEYMDDQLPKLGPFDAVVGFSQGAQMMTALSMWYLHKSNTRWWKCCVSVCGPRVCGAVLRPLFENPDGTPRLVPFPSIHLIGKKDTWYSECLSMVDMYEAHERFVFEHGMGHRFPSERRTQIYDDVARLIRQQCQHSD
ncbi:hypothetical protein BBJ28_00019484 [Nothophytophthora sp. Chile5]|nr:hypothetical protein BBJ28_00019484 [Nothophytophthora sp. Chile5]